MESGIHKCDKSCTMLCEKCVPMISVNKLDAILLNTNLGFFFIINNK